MLQETHSSDLDEKFWTNQWGDKILFCHGMNHSAGVAILFHNCPGKVIVHKSSDNGHWLLCVLTIDDMFIIIGNIYGYNNINQNRELLSEVSEVIMDLKLTFSTDNIILGGDFNMVQDDWLDRFPSKCNSHHDNPILGNFCSSFGLFDPWRDLYPNVCQYSWLKPDGTSKSRLEFWHIFHIKIKLLFQRFRSKGYPQSWLNNALDKVNKLNRHDLLKINKPNKKTKKFFSKLFIDIQ